MDDKGFIRVEDKVTLRTFIAEGVWKVFGLNVVPHIALVCKRKTTDSTTSCTNFISPNILIKVLKFLDLTLKGKGEIVNSQTKSGTVMINLLSLIVKSSNMIIYCTL